MRNLKRALSLTLASVMLLGMMVVGSSAAAGYDDVKKTDNVEAIEVLQAIEVMVGDERGFGPDRPVNRAEMAVVMGKLLSLDYDYYATSCPFNDVYDWARGWVGACYANKIVSGRGEGVYDPGATVTAVEAASMLMRALGYFKYANDVADGFELSTVTQGTKIGIFNDVGSSATEPMTRNQVAQMVLNALRSGVVEPDGNTINLTTPDGSVYTGRVNYVYVTSNKPYARAISKVGATSVGSTNDGSIVELGERLYDGKLKLDEYATDAFQRPARHWEFDGKDIGTYMKKELLKQEYTQKVTGKMLYDLLTKNTIADYDFTIAVDGETTEAVLKNSAAPNSGKTSAWFTKGNLVRTNTEVVGDTGRGVLTQVFVDPDEGDGTVYIAIINTYLAKAVDDYNEKKDEATYKVWSLKDGDSTSRVGLVKDNKQTIELDVKGEDFDIEDVKKSDIVLVHVAEGEIQEIIDPEVIDETTISAFKLKNWVNADGTQYDYADSVQYDPEVLDNYDNSNMKNTNYRLFLDEYGYMIGIEILEEPNEYVFLTGVDLTTSNLSNKTANGFVIHTDGTEATVKINMDKSKNAMGNKFSEGNSQFGSAYDDNTYGRGTGVGSLMNTWCRYTVDSNGTYTLFEVPNTTATWRNLDPNGNENLKGNTGKGKAAQGRNHDETANSNSGRGVELLTLDKSHIYLNSEINGFTRVYTNDNTVFITAETAQINATNAWESNHTPTADKTPAVIINGVDSITTGAANVNLKAWDATRVKVQATPDYTAADRYTSNGVYTLFDKDGYVIAAVVVGEDDGTTTSFAFVHSGNMEQEAYSSADDIYTWTRKVIINGEETTLTEKTDTDPYIANENINNGAMGKGYWVEVKYDANGNVRSVENLSKHNVTNPNIKCPTKDFDTLYVGDNKYIYSIADVEAATDDKNTVLLWDNLVGENKYVSVEGSTLQVRTATGLKDGFAIHPDCKTVLIQDGQPTINDPKYMDSVNYYSGGTDGAKRAVDRLEKNHVFEGFIGAVLENGRATSIIIYDKSAYSIDQGNNVVTPSGDYQVITRTSANSFTVRYYDANFGTANAMTPDQIRDFAAQQVANYFNVPVKNVAWNYMSNTGVVYLDNGTLLGEAANVTTQRVLKISEDGTKRAYVDAKNYSGAGNNLAVPGFTGTTKYLVGKDAVASNGAAAPADYTAAAGSITLTSNLSSSQDINLLTAYEIKLNGITGTVGAVTIPNDNTNASLVVKNATIALTGATGDGTYRSFTDNDGWTSASAQIAAGSKATGSYKVTKAATVAEVSGYLVKVPGKQEVLADGDTIRFEAPVAGAKYGYAKNVAGSGDERKVTAEVAAAKLNSLGTTYEYTVDVANGNDGGVIELVQVVEVTTVLATTQYTKKDGTKANVSDGDLFVVGTELTIATDAPGDATTDTHVIKVGGTAIEGGTAVDYNGGTDPHGASAAYTTKNTDTGLVFTLAAP